MSTRLLEKNETPLSVFWDMDGTQFNSEPTHEKRWYSVAKSVDVVLTPDLFDVVHTFPIPNDSGGLTEVQRPLRGAHETAICYWILHQMKLQGKKEFPDLAWMKEELQKEYRNHAHLIQPREGIPDLIHTLYREGHYQANVTGCNQEIADINLSTLDSGPRSCLKLVIAADHTTRHKPAPEPYLLAFRKTAKIFKRQGYDYATPKKVARKAVIVEDSPTGVESGLRAGPPVIQFLNEGQTPYPCQEKGFNPARLLVARTAEDIYRHIKAQKQAYTAPKRPGMKENTYKPRSHNILTRTNTHE